MVCFRSNCVIQIRMVLKAILLSKKTCTTPFIVFEGSTHSKGGRRQFSLWNCDISSQFIFWIVMSERQTRVKNPLSNIT